jgi:hypothetical protein
VIDFKVAGLLDDTRALAGKRVWVVTLFVANVQALWGFRGSVGLRRVYPLFERPSDLP